MVDRMFINKSVLQKDAILCGYIFEYNVKEKQFVKLKSSQIGISNREKYISREYGVKILLYEIYLSA